LLKKFPKLLPKAVDVLLAALNEGDKKVALEIFRISGLSYRLKKAPWPRFFGSSRPCKVKPRRRARGIFLEVKNGSRTIFTSLCGKPRYDAPILRGCRPLHSRLQGRSNWARRKGLALRRGFPFPTRRAWHYCHEQQEMGGATNKKFSRLI
jgi:hypothetical protein